MQSASVVHLPLSSARTWGEVDWSVFSTNRAPAPPLPLPIFGAWDEWIVQTARSKSAPVDYVAMGLLVTAASLIGNSRKVRAWEGWDEPSVLWAALVGPPSSNKSPALDPFVSSLMTLEEEMLPAYERALQEWETTAYASKVHREAWEASATKAIKDGAAPPLRPSAAETPDKPERPRLKVGDITPERLATLHVAQPKGLLQLRDELSTFFGGMDRYGGNGIERGMYLEAFGARSLSVDRAKSDKPVLVPRFAVCVLGTIQPDKLDRCIMSGDDDGLAARFMYCWPERVPRERPSHSADPEVLRRAFRRLRGLELIPGATSPEPLVLPLEFAAVCDFQKWWEGRARADEQASGMLSGFIGKLDGLALRLALVIEHLWWAVESDEKAPPSIVSEGAMIAARAFIEDYLMPMAKRSFGDSAVPVERRNAVALARHIRAGRMQRVNTRALYRLGTVRGIADAKSAQQAASHLVDCNVLAPAGGRDGSTAGRERNDFEVNPALFEHSRKSGDNS